MKKSSSIVKKQCRVFLVRDASGPQRVGELHAPAAAPLVRSVAGSAGRLAMSAARDSTRVRAESAECRRSRDRSSSPGDRERRVLPLHTDPDVTRLLSRSVAQPHPLARRAAAPASLSAVRLRWGRSPKSANGHG